MYLYRPVGLHELLLIYESGMDAFPPRLPEQPIFYPVLNAAYAGQIANRWNTQQSEKAGYVTRFEVADSYVARFERRIVGSREHEELWIPAEELANFNRHIGGKIEVIEAYFGAGFQGYIPERFGMKGRDAVHQFAALAAIRGYNGADFIIETELNPMSIFVHFPFWMQRDFSAEGIDNEWRYQVLRDVKMLWEERYPAIRLCYAEYA